VIVGRNALFVGGTVSDRLVVSRGGLLRLTATNQPPTVTLTAPGAGASLVAFSSLALAATATDLDGSVAKVEFYDGAARLGVGTATAGQPSAFSLTLPGGLSVGVHTLTAVATDNSGIAATSLPVSVNVALSANAPPKVTLTTPAGGETVAFNASIEFVANATDADGTVVKVEFFDGATKLGETGIPTSPPSTFSFALARSLAPGAHLLTARATDNSGAFADSTPVPITVLASLPYLADFESLEGYALGSLEGQLGWRLSQGAATVTGDACFSGSRSVALLPCSPAAAITQLFAAQAGADVVFADFYAQPVADVDLGAATAFNVGGSRFALLRSGTKGELRSFDGDGANGGQWRTTTFTTPLAIDGHTENWIRFTARLDFGRHTWDLYANGQMAAAGLGFRDNAATALTEFGVQGHATAITRLDYVFAGPQNPLFADVNDNGIDDVWETAHGLSLSNNNRDLSPSGNGVTVLQAYIAGLDPQDYYLGAEPALRWECAALQVRRSGAPALVPLALTILGSSNGNPLPNAPITFSLIAQKAGLLAGSDEVAGSSQLAVRADASGVARAWIKLEAGWNGRIAVRAQVSVAGVPGSPSTLVILPAVDSSELACGADQSLWLDSTGIARTWGRNNEGQLGDGTVADRSQKRRLDSVTAALSSAAFGKAHGMAVTAAGEVLSWGDNFFGQLGDDSDASRRIPSAVGGLSGVVQVAAGDDHSLALCVDGSVWAWGRNQSGQLGDGTFANRAAPVRVAGLANIVRIAAGARHSIALDTDGTVWAWGSNEFGQLGDATVPDRPTPSVIAGVGDIVALVSGRQHVLALRFDGTVWAWGDNHAGQLGLSTLRGQTSPQRISALPFATGLAAGSNHSAALTADAALWTWGANDVGQLGNGSSSPSLSPIKLTIGDVRAFAVGWDHAVVLKNDGSLLAWGLNRHCQLGTRTEEVFINNPAPVDPAVD
jgi:alpha-tubulin suppressor-like RCC1 family protein